MLQGLGPPDPAIGVPGDYYRQLEDGGIWRKTFASNFAPAAWQKVSAYRLYEGPKGPPGPPGPQGPQGQTGPAGEGAVGALLAANNLSDVANASVALANLGGVPTSRTVSTGTGLTGGGGLTADITIFLANRDNGDITVSASGATWTIDNDVVTYAKMQNISATSRILGRKTAAAGDPEECTLSEVLDFIGSAAQGDLLYRGASTWARLGAGTAGQLLKTGGTGANPSWVDQSISAPTARISLASGTAVHTADVSSATTVYVVPYQGGTAWIYNGSVWVPYAFTSELSLALDSNSGHTGYHQSGKNFDVWMFVNSGALDIGTGPAWTSDTARGTGAGTTEYEDFGGLKVNQNSITLRLSATSGDTVSVSARQAVLIGTVRMSADGTTKLLFGGVAANGSEGWLGFDQAYDCNRVDYASFIGDSTDSWSYATTTFRSVHGSDTMRLSYVASVDEEGVAAAFSHIGTFSSGQGRAGIGYDSTSASACTASALFTNIPSPCFFAQKTRGLGFHYLQALERGNTGGNFYGDSGSPTTDQQGMIVWGRY